MELTKDNILDYIRANVDLADMRAHIRKSMNSETLRVYSDFLYLSGKVMNENQEHVQILFIIKHLIMFLVYKESLSIYDAYTLFQTITNDFQNAVEFNPEVEEQTGPFKSDILANAEHDLFIAACAELQLLTGTLPLPVYNTNTIFNHLSKIFIGNPKRMCYQTEEDIQHDLKKLCPEQSVEENAINALNSFYNGNFIPYLLNDYENDILKYIAEISYGITLIDAIDRRGYNDSEIKSVLTGMWENPKDDKTVHLKYLPRGEVNFADALEGWVLSTSYLAPYGKYKLILTICGESDANITFLKNFRIFLNLCEKVRNRMIAYAII